MHVVAWPNLQLGWWCACVGFFRYCRFLPPSKTMHIRLIGVTNKLVLYWGTVHGIVLLSTQGLLGYTPLSPLTLIKNKQKLKGHGSAVLMLLLSLSQYLFFPTFPLLYKVAGIVGRADLLCALFFQLSFLTYCKAFFRGRRLSINSLILGCCRTTATETIRAN